MFRSLFFHPNTTIVNPELSGSLHTTSSFSDFSLHSELDAEEAMMALQGGTSTAGPGPEARRQAEPRQPSSNPTTPETSASRPADLLGVDLSKESERVQEETLTHRDPLYPSTNPRRGNQASHFHDNAKDDKSSYDLLNDHEGEKKANRVLGMAEGMQKTKS